MKVDNWHHATHRLVAITGPSGVQLGGEIRNIPQIRIGRYVLNSVNTLCLNTYKPSVVGNVLILGNAAFNQVVLTIDYRRRKLIIRTREYDIIHEKSAPGAFVIPFTRGTDDGVFLGNPVVPVQVDGHSMHFVLDTGLENVLLLRSIYDHYFPTSERRWATMTSPFAPLTRIQCISNITLSIGGNVFKNQSTVLMPRTQVSEDGSVGRVLLKSFRITIDYPRQRILMEPYNRH